MRPLSQRYFDRFVQANSATCSLRYSWYSLPAALSGYIDKCCDSESILPTFCLSPFDLTRWKEDPHEFVKRDMGNIPFDVVSWG